VDTTTKLLIALPVVLLSMSLHEMMHAFTSHWLGDKTAYLQGRVSINPLRHIDPFFTVALPLLLVLLGAAPFAAAKPVQVNFSRLKFDEFGGAIVGMVGPATNLLIAVAAAVFFRSYPPTSNLAFNVLSYIVVINSGLFIFNSIPWPPLDGSRLLYAFAPKPLQGMMERIEAMGMNGLLIFMLFVITILAVPLSHLISGFANWLMGSNVFIQ
jgi:Zn-dependent protease